MPSKLKPLFWLGSSKPELLELPRPVQRSFGYALYLAQAGGLHVFQKKAARGRETPKPDLDLIKDRLKAARDAAEGL